MRKKDWVWDFRVSTLAPTIKMYSFMYLSVGLALTTLSPFVWRMESSFNKYMKFNGSSVCSSVPKSNSMVICGTKSWYTEYFSLFVHIWGLVHIESVCVIKIRSLSVFVNIFHTTLHHCFHHLLSFYTNFVLGSMACIRNIHGGHDKNNREWCGKHI